MGHHEARDGRTVSLWKFFRFVMGLSGDELYGEVRFKMRKGEVVGQVHVEKDHLVEQLPDATPTQIQELLKGVSLS